MTESSGHEGIGERPSVRKGLSPEIQVILSVVMGVVVDVGHGNVSFETMRVIPGAAEEARRFGQ